MLHVYFHQTSHRLDNPRHNTSTNSQHDVAVHCSRAYIAFHTTYCKLQTRSQSVCFDLQFPLNTPRSESTREVSICAPIFNYLLPSIRIPAPGVCVKIANGLARRPTSSLKFVLPLSANFHDELGNS
jgi:hypothetical protein